MNLSKKQYFFSVILLVFSSVVFSADLAKMLKPKTRTVMINPITQGVINLMPGRTVKIIFPWVLDKADSSTPYYARLSRDNIFKKEEKAGQNTILLYTDQIAKNLQGEYAELSISSGGFHFTFTIIADFNYRKHYSNIILKLGKKEKLRLLEDEKKRYLASLKQEREAMLSEINAKAEVIALTKVGELSRGSTSSSNVKEEQEMRFDNGDSMVLYVDEITEYGSFSVLNIEIENKSGVKPLYLQDMKMQIVVDGGINKLVRTGNDMPPKLESNQVAKIVVVTNEKIPTDNLVVSLTTDRGDIEVSW